MHHLKLFQMRMKCKVLPSAPRSHVGEWGGIPMLILSLCLIKIVYIYKR